VEIVGGGRQLIRITDDGCGMGKDDALLCLERHATSKIRQLDEIHAIDSMGFRGEAIPSIASISKMTILTCPKPEAEATLVIIEGGKVRQCSAAARSPGTTIEVKSLFYNVPVRKKFQKSPNYDASEIQRVITALALGHPNVKFTLLHNQKTLLQTHPNSGEKFMEQLGQRIGDVLGKEFRNATCPIDVEKGEYRFQGYLGFPSTTRPNKTGQYLFVNRRAVVSPLVGYAIRDGYGTALPTNRYPLFVLHLTMVGSLVDVNVHPQKREVRLRQEQNLRESLMGAVQEAFQQSGEGWFKGEVEEEIIKIPPAATPDLPFPEPIAPVFDFKRTDPKPVENQEELFPLETRDQPPDQQEELPIPYVATPSIPKVNVFACLKDYILVDGEGEEGINVIDQRAAHSRVIFEELEKRRDANAPIASQSLLIPHTLEKTPWEGAVLRDNLEALNRIGIEIEEFGQNTFLIQAFPTIFASPALSPMLPRLGSCEGSEQCH